MCLNVVLLQIIEQDVVRTLMSRCELLYEDVIDVVEEDSGKYFITNVLYTPVSHPCIIISGANIMIYFID